MDTDLEREFDGLLRLAAHICGVPYAALLRVEDDHQWFHAVLGFESADFSPGIALGTHFVLSHDLLIVPDTQADPRFANSPVVIGESNIRFYARVPLVTQDGTTLGFLCIFHRTPRQLTSTQKETLRLLACQITKQIQAASQAVEQQLLLVDRLRLATIVESSQDAILAATLDGIVTSWNKGAERLYGYTAAEMIGHHFSVLTPLDERDSIIALVERLLEGESIKPLEVIRRHRNGTEFHASLSFFLLYDATESAIGVSCTACDISERKAMELALRESQHFAETIATNAACLIYIFDLETLTVAYSNMDGSAFVGYTQEQIKALGSQFLTTVYHPDDVLFLRTHLAEFSHSPDGKLIEYEVRFRHISGEWHWVWQRERIFKRHPDGRPLQILGTAQDVTERKRMEVELHQSAEQIREYNGVLEFQKRQLEKANAELAALATTDGLTGLHNHRSFQERLAEEVGLALRHDILLSLVLLDVDCFKSYNDAYGHPAGDTVLRAVANILQDCARDTDVVARYGGEEFVLLLPQTDQDGAAIFAERMREAVERYPWPVRTVTASFGVACLYKTDESGAGVVARADAALYLSKKSGRNCVTCDNANAPMPATTPV